MATTTFSRRPEVNRQEWGGRTVEIDMRLVNEGISRAIIRHGSKHAAAREMGLTRQTLNTFQRGEQVRPDTFHRILEVVGLKFEAVVTFLEPAGAA